MFSVVPIARQYARELSAIFVWIGLGDAGPWDTLMVTFSEHEMAVSGEGAETISGGNKNLLSNLPRSGSCTLQIKNRVRLRHEVQKA